ncbi:keratin, type I cytoskeletal 13-like [Esox lucius]|uniref:IF rod domain-containing protein n=1 Tax=Esox lucius TaxID=8010 RepID=A0A3P9AEL9_ESOLU|nr:keratin, type I cytoskeletal 13-like [Esox lucius]
MTTFSSRSSTFSSRGAGWSSGASVGDSFSSMGGSRMSRSVYGGGAGQGIRMSYAASSSSAGGGRFGSTGGGFGFGGSGAGGGTSFGGFSMNGGAGGGESIPVSEKATMQNLNTRLATYLEKVATLEKANAKLELQIKEWGLSHVKVDPKDLSSHQAAIAELRSEFLTASTAMTGLALQVENTKLTADDFRMKYENELAMRQSVEADIGGLKRILNEMSLSKSDLEMQLEDLKEEKAYIQKNHEEETVSFRAQMSGQVQVEVDAAPTQDLNAVISEIREQYEAIVAKSRREAEAWFNNKAEVVQQEVSSSTEVLQTTSVELKSSQSTSRSLEQELQSLQSMKASLEGNLAEIEARYGSMMISLQTSVTGLESQLTQIRADTERSSKEYQALLDIKNRLEMEIGEYRRLLEGGDTGFAVTNTIVGQSNLSSVKTESSGGVSSPVKIVTVIEELVDGKVVSSSSSTK